MAQPFLKSSEYYLEGYRTPIVELIISVAILMIIVLAGSFFCKMDNTINRTGFVVKNVNYKSSSMSNY